MKVAMITSSNAYEYILLTSYLLLITKSRFDEGVWQLKNEA